MTHITPIPAFNDNYIWLIVNADRATVVDPGDATPVIETLTEQNLTLDSILITHHHLDHTGGVDKLLSHFAATVYAPYNTPLKHCDVRLEQGDTVALKHHELTFQIIATPGHTLDHICYYSPGILFCGDTLFAGGCGRVFEGDNHMMWQSLHKLEQLPDQTKVYCAHEYTQANLNFAQQVEPNNSRLKKRIEETRSLRDQQQPTLPSTIGIENDTNPFLRCHQPRVIEAAQHLSEKKLNSPAEVFSIIRDWKNRC